MPRLSASSTVACAGCKHQRRKCEIGCRFAPYFPASDPNKFVSVHNVYGARNVSKILDDVEPEQRAFTVESLVFEANARLSSPAHGCVGIMYGLKGKIEELQSAIANARNELSAFTGPAAFGPLVPPYVLDPEKNEMGQFGAAMIVAAEGTREQQLEQEMMSFVQQQQNDGLVARITISQETVNDLLDQHQYLSLDQCQLPDDQHMQLHPGQHQLLDQHMQLHPCQHQLLDQNHHLVQQISGMAT